MSNDAEPDPRRIATDPAAFERFYREHVAAIQRFVARRVADPYRAADLTADIFLRVIDSAHTYRPGRGGAVAWLYGIARNVVAGEWRQRHREHQARRRLSGRRLLAEEDLARIEARIDAQAQSRRLYAAMERLTAKERAVLELVALEEMPLRHVADALDIQPMTARVRLYRARRTMREWLEDHPAEDAPPQLTSEVPS
ncbi:RNA polymerase sigma factor [Halostreptopolyspora alba]|uniref:Sigma-70 family RNA polymerase sigma factor n=1 Tax=Halostreptopolyspora alba TaxID=2487137 RepID=A0A3N0E945_9ACTN|nr:sigma-70 family RNA polymerase sigma factor [Nocardiopsaceae bacterium YIM 96095]